MVDEVEGNDIYKHEVTNEGEKSNEPVETVDDKERVVCSVAVVGISMRK